MSAVVHRLASVHLSDLLLFNTHYYVLINPQFNYLSVYYISSARKHSLVYTIIYRELCLMLKPFYGNCKHEYIQLYSRICSPISCIFSIVFSTVNVTCCYYCLLYSVSLTIFCWYSVGMSLWSGFADAYLWLVSLYVSVAMLLRCVLMFSNGVV